MAGVEEGDNPPRALAPFALAPFLGLAAPLVRGVRVDGWVELGGGGVVRLAYALSGGGGVHLPPPPPGGPALSRRDALWESTCFEAFLAPRTGGGAYWEVNLSTDGGWQVYKFSGYREGMTPDPEAAAERVACERGGDGELSLRAEVRIPGLAAAAAPGGVGADAGCAAILRHGGAAGDESFWAVAHKSERPDFHLRESFAHPLPAAAPP